MSDFVTGQRTTFDDGTDHIIQVEDGIKFLNPRSNGIKFVKKLIANRGGKVAKSVKYNWDETALPARREIITIDGSSTTLTVANSKIYPVGTVLKSEDEVMRVTAAPSATTLSVVRGYAGTTAAAHSAKIAMNLGVAGAENSTGPVAISTTADRLYNYVQMFEDAVEMSEQEMAELSSESGAPFDRQVERITLWFWKKFAQSVFYGTRYEDSANELHLMGGVNQFLSTNVTNVGGALTIAALDAEILNLVRSGGEDVDTLVMGPYQKQKLDALDASLVRTGKKTVGGNPISMTWQSGILDTPLDIIVDQTILDDEIYVLDTSKLSIVPLKHNGVDGRLSVVDGTAKGQAGKRSILRAYYTFQVDTEAGLAKLEGLS